MFQLRSYMHLAIAVSLAMAKKGHTKTLQILLFCQNSLFVAKNAVTKPKDYTKGARTRR